MVVALVAAMVIVAGVLMWRSIRWVQKDLDRWKDVF
jgi:HAMP domain-containing protein